MCENTHTLTKQINNTKYQIGWKQPGKLHASPQDDPHTLNVYTKSK